MFVRHKSVLMLLLGFRHKKHLVRVRKHGLDEITVLVTIDGGRWSAIQ